MVKTACVVCGRKDMLHRFPDNLKRCTKWLEQCNKMDLIEKGVKCLHQNYRLCRRHFKPWCFTSNESKCLIRCAHPEIFDMPPEKKDQLQLKHSNIMEIGEPIPSSRETNYIAEHDDEIDIIEQVVVPATKKLNNQESHLVIYNNVKGFPLSKIAEKECLYSNLENDEIQEETKEKYALTKSSPKSEIKVEISANVGSNLMSDFQKTKNIFSTFNQSTYLFSNVEMACLCLGLVKCKKIAHTVGSSGLEELIHGLIYSFRNKFKDKEDESKFGHLVCDLMES